MAREIENLEIIIDVAANAGDIIDLIAGLELLEELAESLAKIDLKVNVKDRELDTLIAKLTQANMMGVGTRFAGGGGGGVGMGSFPAMASVDIQDNMARALNETNEHLMSVVRLQENMVQSIDEIDISGGRTFRNLSDSANKAQGIFGSLNLRMSDMHNMLAKIVPLLLVFIGTLPALITAVVALAAAALSAALALSAIGAIGLLGAVAARSGTGRPTMEAFEEMMGELTDGIVNALLPLGQRFAPLAERALEGIVVMFERLEMVAGRALIGLTDDAVAFGRFMMDFIPGAVRNMALMTEAFGPVFSMIADFMRNVGFLEPLTELFAVMLPDLVTFMAILGRLVPTIIKFSVGLLHVVNVVLILIAGLSKLASIFFIDAEALGVFIGTVFTLITAISILNSTIISKLLSTMSIYLTAMYQYTVATLKGAWANGILATSAGIAAGAIKVLTYAIVGLLAMTGIGILLSIVGNLAAGFLSTSSAIDEATSSLKNFDKYSRRTGDGFNPYAPPSGVQPGGMGSGGSRSVTVNIDGNADKEDVDTATRNAMWRMNKGI